MFKKSVILFVFLIGLIAWVTYSENHVAKNVANTQVQNAFKQSAYSSKMETVIKEALNNGGILVQCLNKRCYDTATAEYLGEGINGYFILYPDPTVSNKNKAKHLSEQVKQLSK